MLSVEYVLSDRDDRGTFDTRVVVTHRPVCAMGAGISVRNETEFPILVVCSQLTPLHWGRCDPGCTWNAKNEHRMGKVRA